ncbi:hypothetical protein EWM64_g8942 [Hericium alpestre]|uniref:Uncharacterized protein n=1 Tax=Hericium alpestre TaxID=135208 RepID=A0A4Y9ZLD2_9AGAM|nr:hypothetical protein EWM64_g8942 [Hericium alpestre]
MDAASFGFLDPDDVIREAHLIPAFVHGQTEQEWDFYYVNIFADRDIFMRYAGIGVGHSYHIELPADELRASDGDDNAIDNAAEGESTPPINEDEVEIETDLDDDDKSSVNGEDGERHEDVDIEEEEYLGPEDGEGKLDIVDQEGYGDL